MNLFRASALAISLLVIASTAHGQGGIANFRGSWSNLTYIPRGGVVPQQGSPLAVGQDGVRHVAYTAYGPCPYTVCGVFYQSSADGITWTAAVLVPGSEDVGSYCAPDVVTCGNRAYVAWSGSSGLEISWTDDGGAHFAPVVAPDPSVPGWQEIGSECDVTGSLHFAWIGNENLYYLRSFPSTGAIRPGSTEQTPIFLPAQRLVAEDDLPGFNVFVGVDRAGFVSIVYSQETIPSHIRFTRAYQGIGFPPSIDLGEAAAVQLAVSPDGPITIPFARYSPYTAEVYTLVSMDGYHWEGPYHHSPGKLAGFGRQRSVRAGNDGRIYAVWPERQTWTYWVTRYAESFDYGRTFPLLDALDNEAWHMSLALTPDGVACMVTPAEYYVEYR